MHSRYERNTLGVENGLADILMAEPTPRAVIMVGTYAPCAEFIRLAKANQFPSLFLNVSFVGAEPLAQDLGRDGDGVIITQVVPHFDADFPIVMEYRRALKNFDDNRQPSFASLEGYIAARILFKALRTIEGRLTREAVVDALENLGPFNIGLGVLLHLDKNNHQACHRVWPMVLKKGRPVPFQWKDLSSRTRGNDDE